MSTAVLRRVFSLLVVIVAGADVPANLAATHAVSLAPRAVVARPSPYARCTSGGAVDSPESIATNSKYVNTEVEPYVAANPRTMSTPHLNLIGVWQQDRWSNGGAQGIVAASSFDGGNSWRESPLPFSVCASHGSPFLRASDPWVSIGPDGTAYASALSISSTANAVLTATSVDGGRSWGKARAIIADRTSRYLNDKESITADPVRPGLAYATWNRTRQPIDSHHLCTWFARTTDRGRTWSRPRQIVPARPEADTFGHQIVVDPRTDVLYDVFAVSVGHGESEEVREERSWRRALTTSGGSTSGTSIAFVKSTDHGMTWSLPRSIARVHDVDRLVGTQYRLGNPGPTAAVDPVSGALYVAWTDTQRDRPERPDIALTRSSDGGTTWSAPLHLTGSGKRPAFTPAIAINAHEVIGLSFYSTNDLYVAFTGTDPSPPPVRYDAWFVGSSDGGRHFGFKVQLGGPFDYRKAPFAGGYFLGDYQGLAAAGREFHPFFVMTSSGHTGDRAEVVTTSVRP